MKKLSAIFLSLLLLTGCASQPSAGTYQQISQAQAAEIMKTEENYILLDVRTPEEFSQRRIPGAVNLPNEEISAKNLSLLPDRDQIILVYCRSGNRSKQASQKLADLGYTQVMEFGGINTWNGEIQED